MIVRVRNRLAAGLASLTLFATAAAGAAEAPVQARVLRVTSGDSMQLLMAGGGRAARLAAVDAPEGTQKYGAQAHAALKALVEGKEVGVLVVGEDRFRRLLVRMTLASLDVNAWVVREGHAWAFRRYMTGPELCGLEHEARAARRGLWAQPPADWIYPSEWRRVQRAERTGRFTDFSAETAARCIADIGKR